MNVNSTTVAFGSESVKKISFFTGLNSVCLSDRIENCIMISEKNRKNGYIWYQTGIGSAHYIIVFVTFCFMGTYPCMPTENMIRVPESLMKDYS